MLLTVYTAVPEWYFVTTSFVVPTAFLVYGWVVGTNTNGKDKTHWLMGMPSLIVGFGTLIFIIASSGNNGSMRIGTELTEQIENNNELGVARDFDEESFERITFLDTTRVVHNAGDGKNYILSNNKVHSLGFLINEHWCRGCAQLAQAKTGDLIYVYDVTYKNGDKKRIYSRGKDVFLSYKSTIKEEQKR